MQLEEIDLYLTNRCNLSCNFCSVEARRDMAELPLGKIQSIILEAKQYGLKELHLTGGEPTLRDDLELIVDFAVNHGLNVRLITNGTYLTYARLKTLYSLGLRSIMISLDGLEKYHNSVRGCGSFQKTMQTISNAISLSGMTVRVNSVAWRDNVMDIEELLTLLNSMGVHIYSIFLGSPLGYAKKYMNNVIPALEWKSFCESIREKVAKHIQMQVIVEKGYLFADDEKNFMSTIEGRGRGCYKITNHTDFILIRSNGDIYPCVFFSNEAPKMGNIMNSTLKEILDSFTTNNFYSEIGKAPSSCSCCEQLSWCHGGCRGYAKLYTDGWYKKDPRCDLNANKQIIPLCPIVKYNVNKGILGGSSEQVLK